MLTGHDRGCSAIIRKLINRAKALFMFCKGTAKGLKNKIKHSFLSPLQACIRLCGTYQPTVVSTPVRLPTYVRPISVPLRRIYRLFQSAITAATSNTYPTLPQQKKAEAKHLLPPDITLKLQAYVYYFTTYFLPLMMLMPFCIFSIRCPARL